MMPGRYVMAGGGFRISGAGAVTAINVFIYNTRDPYGAGLTAQYDDVSLFASSSTGNAGDTFDLFNFAPPDRHVLADEPAGVEWRVVLEHKQSLHARGDWHCRRAGAGDAHTGTDWRCRAVAAEAAAIRRQGRSASTPTVGRQEKQLTWRSP